MRLALLPLVALLLSCSHQKTVAPSATVPADVDAIVVPADVPGWWRLCFAPSPMTIPGEPDMAGPPNCVGTVDQWRHAAKHLLRADLNPPANEGENAR